MIRGFEFFPFFVAVRVTVLGRPERWTRGSFGTMADQPSECFWQTLRWIQDDLLQDTWFGITLLLRNPADQKFMTQSRTESIKLAQIGFGVPWGPANKTFQATFEASLCYQIWICQEAGVVSGPRRGWIASSKKHFSTHDANSKSLKPWQWMSAGLRNTGHIIRMCKSLLRSLMF